MMGTSMCPKCKRPAFHINGDPATVTEVTAMFEEQMGLNQPEAHLTDTSTGRPKLDG